MIANTSRNAIRSLQLMPTPGETPPPASPLRVSLRERRARALLADAEFIRDHPDFPERDQEGQRHIREAMHEHTVGRITLLERDHILRILSFTSVRQVPDIHDSPPAFFHD
jgi:hypothetical protein